MLTNFVTLALAASASIAAPLADKRSGTACTVSDYAGFASCASSTNIVVQGNITVPANQVINWSNLQAGTTVTLTGTVNFAKGTLDKTNYLISVGGSGITFTGPGTLNGNGQLYWDGKGANSGVKKPKMFRVTTTGGSTFSGFTIKNTPIHCFSIAGSATTFDGITIDNAAGDAGGGHNTDGFDVSASGITIQNCHVHNQDDCLAVNHGSNIQFNGNTCVGGHGISIGSVQSGSVVNDVSVSNCTVANSDNGVRVKTVYKATAGSVTNVSYKDIVLSNIAKMGIVVRQDYLNGGPTGKAVSKMPITNLTLSNIQGSVKSGANSVFVLCATGECTEFNWSNINITAKKTSCTGVTPVGC
ncbi:hypothetical protein HDU83_009957 [Entophlyctis luteolus]|nr:hypothetical protein HDU83_009957 [Entophlyctis luteolus]